MKIYHQGQQVILILCFTSFSSTFTSIMSGPTCTIHLKGMIYSKSLHTRPHHFVGPATIIAFIQPVHISNSMSWAHPKILQLHVFMTSFLFKSSILIKNPFLLLYSFSHFILHFILYSFAYFLWHFFPICLPAPVIYRFHPRFPSVFSR